MPLPPSTSSQATAGSAYSRLFILFMSLRLWKRLTSLLARLWHNLFRRRSLTKANSELMRSIIEALAGWASTKHATDLISRGTLAPFWFHHLCAGILSAALMTAGRAKIPCLDRYISSCALTDFLGLTGWIFRIVDVGLLCIYGSSTMATRRLEQPLYRRYRGCSSLIYCYIFRLALISEQSLISEHLLLVLFRNGIIHNIIHNTYYT